MNWKQIITLGFLGVMLGAGQCYGLDVNIPGATPTIDEMRYRDYRVSGFIAELIDKKISNNVESIKMAYPQYTNDEIEKLKYVVKEVNHATNHSYTVYMLKENGADIMFTLPFASVATVSKKFKEDHTVTHQTVTPVGNIGVEVQQRENITNWNNTQVPYDAVTKNVIRDEINKAGKEQIRFIDGNTFTYKNFDLSVFAMARYGQTINSDLLGYYTAEQSVTTNQLAGADYWTENNQGAYYPAPGTGSEQSTVISALRVRDGSFIKVKNITLGYTFPVNISRKALMEKCRIYATAYNPFIYVKDKQLKGTDPETNGSDAFPTFRQFVFGVNLTF